MTIWKMTAVIFLLLLFGSSQVVAQPGPGGDIPVAGGLNKLFAVEGQWALYGAPQPGPITEADWEILVGNIRKTSFGVDLVQVVVIISDSDVEGTLGLIDRRKGRRVTTRQVGQDGSTPYDIWRDVGYRTTARKIYVAHQENVLAIDRYRGMPVIFSSRVRRVAFDSGGATYIELKVGNSPSDGALACYPWVGAPQLVNLTTLTEGDSIKVTCQVASFTGKTLKMTSCLFEHHDLLKDLL